MHVVKTSMKESPSRRRYVDLYASLFDPIRESTRAIAEVGVALGQSLQVWHAYFPNAIIWGIEWPELDPRLVKVASGLGSRVHVRKLNSQSAAHVQSLGLLNESLDIVIDDAEHTPFGNERTLLAWWPLVKPGGLYLIEDVATGARLDAQPFYNRVVYDGEKPNARHAYNPLVHNATTLSPAAKRIFDEHDSYFVDTAPGHRAWDEFTGALRRFSSHLPGRRVYARDRLNHNSHVLVLRKRRTGPRTRPVTMNIGHGAMTRVTAEPVDTVSRMTHPHPGAPGT